MKQRGFSLLELSIVLTIMAIVVASGLTLGTAKIQQEETVETYDEMEEIVKGLRVFLNEYGRLPCPASLTLTYSDPLYGREATDCSDASPPAGIVRVMDLAHTSYVRIGGVPFYSLEMPDKFLEDAWNGRYLYAVQEDAITSLTSSSTGNIRIIDSAGNTLTDTAVMALVSHGKTHMGAYTAKTGALYSACDGAIKDGDNCNGDGIFTDGLYNDGGVAANFYDDLIIWKTRMGMFETVSTEGGFKPWDIGGGSATSNYPLEIKGVTASYAANLGLAAYNTACNTAYPGSWVLRSSDLKYLNGLPNGLSSERFVIDDCTGDTGDSSADADYCFITPNVRLRVSPAGASGVYTNTRAILEAMNCRSWTVTGGADLTGVLLSTASAITPDTFRSDAVTSDTTTFSNQSHTASSWRISTDDCSASRRFVCVGED